MKCFLMLLCALISCTNTKSTAELEEHLSFLESYLTPERAAGAAYRPPFFDWAVDNLHRASDGPLHTGWKPGLHCTVGPDGTMHILQISEDVKLVPHKILPPSGKEKSDSLRQQPLYLYFHKDIGAKGKLRALERIAKSNYQKVSIVSVLDTEFSVNRAPNSEVVQYVLNKISKEPKVSRDSLAAKLTLALINDCEGLRSEIQKAYHADFDSVGQSIVKILKRYNQMEDCNIARTVNVIYAIALPRLEFTMITLDTESAIEMVKEQPDAK
jgi:hypothetical protein